MVIDNEIQILELAKLLDKDVTNLENLVQVVMYQQQEIDRLREAMEIQGFLAYIREKE